MLSDKACLKAFGQPATDRANAFMVLWVVPADCWHPRLPKRIYCHKLMVQPLSKAFKALIKTGRINELKSWDGCYCVRPQRGSSVHISLHSWGLAIDVNAAWNPRGHKGVLTPEFVKCWTDSGFDWGGDFTTTIDPMHFQLKAIM